MNMKRLLVSIALVSMLFVVGCNSESQSTPINSPPAVSTENKSETMVYVTNSGTKYHRSGCRYLNKSKIETGLNDAINEGYEPCSVCKPPKK